MDEAELRDMIPPKEENPLLKRKPLNLGSSFQQLSSPEEPVEVENMVTRPHLTLLFFTSEWVPLALSSATSAAPSCPCCSPFTTRSTSRRRSSRSSTSVSTRTRRSTSFGPRQCPGWDCLSRTSGSPASRSSTTSGPSPGWSSSTARARWSTTTAGRTSTRWTPTRPSTSGRTCARPRTRPTTMRARLEYLILHHLMTGIPPLLLINNLRRSVDSRNNRYECFEII